MLSRHRTAVFIPVPPEILSIRKWAPPRTRILLMVQFRDLGRDVLHPPVLLCMSLSLPQQFVPTKLPQNVYPRHPPSRSDGLPPLLRRVPPLGLAQQLPRQPGLHDLLYPRNAVVFVAFLLIRATLVLAMYNARPDVG